MRGESLLGSSLLDRINAELDGVAAAKPIVDAPHHQADPHVTFLPAKEALPNRFAALTGQFAIAASIAFAVVIGVKVVAPVDTQPSVAVAEPLEVEEGQGSDTVANGACIGKLDGEAQRAGVVLEE